MDQDSPFQRSNSTTTIRRSDLGILVECGDEDCFSLMDGAEYPHRVLWDLDVSHEYHLVGSAAGPAVLRLMTEAQRRGAAEQDPTVTRRYGVLPSLQPWPCGD